MSPTILHFDAQESAHIDSSVDKLRNLERKLIHALQGEAGQRDIGRRGSGVLAVWHAASVRVVMRTPVAGVNYDWDAGECVQRLQPIQQA